MIQFYLNCVTNTQIFTTYLPTVHHHALQYEDHIMTTDYCNVTSNEKYSETVQLPVKAKFGGFCLQHLPHLLLEV